MFNVAVVRLKDLIRYASIMIFIIVAICIVKGNTNKNVFIKGANILVKNVKNSLQIVLPGAKSVVGYRKKNKDNSLKNIHEKMLGLELSAFNMIEKKQVIASTDNSELDLNSQEDVEVSLSGKENEIDNDKNAGDIEVITDVNQFENNVIAQNIQTEETVLSTNDNTQEDLEDATNVKEENIVLAQKNIKTEVVTKNPIAETYTKKYNGVKIKNETKFNLTDEVLNPESLEINKANIIIFHTHTCESYTATKENTYTPTANFRTTDLNYTVARVGDELTKYLENYNINVLHDKTYHDYPSYNGSYSRSLSTVTKLLKNTNADIIIDLHRDAIGSYSSYAPTVKIGDDLCAQVMFVIGSNGGGLKHTKWKQNLKFAVKMQETANSLYPGLFKPIILRNSRYNQHLGKAACIIEVGSTGNTLEQCLNSMKYLAEVINEL